MFLNEACNKVHADESLFDAFPIQMAQKKEMLYHHYFPTFVWNVALGRCKKTKFVWN
jgi:hypothetical protein